MIRVSFSNKVEDSVRFNGIQLVSLCQTLITPHKFQLQYCDLKQEQFCTASFQEISALTGVRRSRNRGGGGEIVGCAMASTSAPPPWKEWPHELPLRIDQVQLDNFKFLEDDAFYKGLVTECRQNAIAALTREIRCENSAILLAGGKSSDFDLYDTDIGHCPFRQEAFFRYIFGVNEPDCVGIIDLSTKESILLVPEQPEEYTKWCGKPHDHGWYESRFGVTLCAFTKDLHEILQKRKISQLYTLSGMNTDSGRTTSTTATFDQISEYKLDSESIYPILSECRVFKTPKEVEYIRRAMLVSSQAHVYVMRHAKPGISERQLEAMFGAWCEYFGGARHNAYTCICASGPNASILHYGHAGRPNDRFLKDGDILMLDMGGEYRGYATDITCAYPVNGEFTDDQRLIFEAVLSAQRAVLAAMKPGVLWPDMHRLAEKVILQHLDTARILHNGTIEEYIEANLGTVFMPHGLGHFIGLAVHDVGGFTAEHPRRTEPGICYLRTARVLQAGMLTSVEPGCYFIDDLLDKALADDKQGRFLNASVLRRFRGFGGVRLEDDVLVTPDGIENFTICPRTVNDIWAVMNGK
uniref:Xaa-Pro dipeptidase n=1 Tax=Hirondellea gigas TaxID=1518452 RepID=A0A6A7G5N1_9CRUS